MAEFRCHRICPVYFDSRLPMLTVFLFIKLKSFRYLIAAWPDESYHDWKQLTRTIDNTYRHSSLFSSNVVDLQCCPVPFWCSPGRSYTIWRPPELLESSAKPLAIFGRRRGEGGGVVPLVINLSPPHAALIVPTAQNPWRNNWTLRNTRIPHTMKMIIMMAEAYQ